MAGAEMDAEKKKVGWIGLGKMGHPMARRLLDGGFALTVFNRTPGKARELVDLGAREAGSAGEAAAASDLVFTMIADDAALEEVTTGENGVLRTAAPGSVLIDMSTVSPGASAAVARQASARGVHYLRAPVSGSTRFAEQGALTIFVSGPVEVYQRCAGVLGALGRKLFHVGQAEEARTLKLLINMMVGTTAMMVAEALAFGEKSGLSWNQMVDVVGQSVVASPLVGYKTQTLKDRNFTPSFTADQIAKDFDLALDAGRSLCVPMPVTALVRQFFGSMKATGRGNLDLFGVVRLLEELAGIEGAGRG